MAPFLHFFKKAEGKPGMAMCVCRTNRVAGTVKSPDSSDISALSFLYKNASMASALGNWSQGDKEFKVGLSFREFKANLCYLRPCLAKGKGASGVFQLSNFMGFHDWVDSRCISGWNTGKG